MLLTKDEARAIMEDTCKNAEGVLKDAETSIYEACREGQKSVNIKCPKKCIKYVTKKLKENDYNCQVGHDFIRICWDEDFFKLSMWNIR